MQRYDVTRAEQSVHCGLLNAGGQRSRALARYGKDIHAESHGKLSHLHADMSQPYNTNILARQLYERTVPMTEIGTTAPLSVARSTCVMVYLIGYVENVGKCMLRHTIGTVGRNVCNYDAVA